LNFHASFFFAFLSISDPHTEGQKKSTVLFGFYQSRRPRNKLKLAGWGDQLLIEGIPIQATVGAVCLTCTFQGGCRLERHTSVFSIKVNEWTSFRMYITLQLQVLQLRLANWFDEKPSKTHKCYLEGSQGPMFVYRPLDAILTPYKWIATPILHQKNSLVQTVTRNNLNLWHDSMYLF
jgi:hypothetical protein